MIHIITDSTSDFPLREAADRNIHIVPMKVRFNNDEYKDGIDMDARRFYHLLEHSAVLPKTSCPSPFDFEDVLEKLLVHEEDKAIIITLSSDLSGCYQSARLGAEDYGERVCVIDSRTASMGEQILVDEAVRLRDSSLPFTTMVNVLQNDLKRIHVVALLNTLEYLEKGGRISKVTAAAGKLLNIKPVIAFEEGKVRLMGKARGIHTGHNLLKDYITKTGGIDFTLPCMLAYSGEAKAALDAYVKASDALYEGHEDQLKSGILGPAIGTYSGPGAIGAAWFARP